MNWSIQWNEREMTWILIKIAINRLSIEIKRKFLFVTLMRGQSKSITDEYCLVENRYKVKSSWFFDYNKPARIKIDIWWIDVHFNCPRVYIMPVGNIWGPAWDLAWDLFQCIQSLRCQFSGHSSIVEKPAVPCYDAECHAWMKIK